MRSRFSRRWMSGLALWAAASAAVLGVGGGASGAPLAQSGASALSFPTDEARAEQITRANLMLGLSTRSEHLVGQTPYWQAGRSKPLWVVEPVRGDLRTATELALTSAPGVAPTMVAINQLVVRFEGNVDLDEAARRLRRAGLQGEVRPSLAPSTFVVRTRSAMEALTGADALAKTPGVRFAHPDGVAPMTTGGDERGTAPEIRVEEGGNIVNDGATVDFGATTQGVPVTKTFTIFNDGTANLVFEIPTVTGSFTLVNPPGSTNLPPLQSTTFIVRMNADLAGAVTGDITFLTNDADENPFDIDLIGTVNAPGGAQEIRVTQGDLEILNNDTFDFGTTTQGAPITYVFTISNIGGQPLSIGTVGVAGSGYTVLSQPASPVNAGGTTEFSVRLDAATQGSFNRVLQFLNNDSDENPFVIVLNGTVSEPVPDSEIAVFNGETELQSGDLVFFGNTEEGSPLAVTLQIRNTGAGPLTIGQIRVPAGFSLAQPPPPTINSGDAAPVSFTLDAIFAGAFAGSVTIANNDVNENPFTILTAGFVAASEPSGGVDDANFIDQWHHANDGSDGGAPGYDVRTPAAWSRTLGEQVIVAVMDNGSQPDHPEYNDNVAGQYLNVIQPGTGAGGEHGTAVAGLVAGEANFAGGRGTAPRSQLFLTNTFNISFTEAADAFYAANTARAAVHTNSWGFLNPNFAPDVIVNAIADLSANGRDGLGMNILFAAANDNRPVVWSSVLAVMPETITVGSLTNGGRRSGYSNYGPWLDFVAPSSGGQRRVFTTDLTGVAGYNPSQSADGGDFTNGFGGTSAATPIAAGVLALVHSINPALHADQVRRIMRKASRDVLVVGDDRPFARLTGFSDSFGYGLIDANAAVIAATQSLANGGFTWPEPVTDLNVTRSGIGATIGWINPADSAPQNEYAGAVLVRYSASLLWTPTDGVNYGLLVGSSPAAGVTILAAGDINAFVDSQANANSNVTYAVYTHNDVFHYSDPTIFKLNPREPQQLFFDDMEGADPGWDFSPPTGGGFPGPGGPGDDEGTNEWERGAPVLDTITLEGSYSCNGAPCQLAFFLGNPIDMFAAIAGFNQPYSGANVWATDLDGVYAPGSVHRLVTPVIDLSDPERRFGSFSISWQELLEIEGSGADVARVIIYDADSGSIIRTLINSHTEMTYQWREQWFDLRNQRGRRIQVAFVLTTDNQGQFLGWYIDDVRVAGSFGNSGPLPPTGPRRIILPGFEIFSQMSPDAGSGGDINYDGLVTMEDASELIQQFGRTRDRSDFSFDADLDGNGRIGVGDLILMMALIHEAGPEAPSTVAP